MQSKFAIMRNNRHKMAARKELWGTSSLQIQAERQDRRPTITVDHWPKLDPEYFRPPFVWWDPRTWRM
jgi:hypothetical protein